jgi:VWFA-related protein
MSYSSTFKISEIHSAALAFINQLHPNDKVMVVSFDEEVHVLCEPTNDRERLRLAIKSTQIASGTSLYEAVDLVINHRLKKINGRKAVVLFTDGVDTTSRRAYLEDNLRDATETDSLIYPIEYDTYNDVQRIKNNPTVGAPTIGSPQKSPVPGTGSPFPFPLPGTRTTLPSPLPRTGGNRSPLPFPVPTSPGSQGTSAEDYRKAGEYLRELADSTSGRVYKASTTVNLADAFTKIANELRQIYSLGFYPAEEKAGRRRQLKVRVNKEGAVVRARESYVVGEKKIRK